VAATPEQLAAAFAEGTQEGLQAGIQPMAEQVPGTITIQTGLPEDLLAVFNGGLRGEALLTGILRELKALNAKLAGTAPAEQPAPQVTGTT
jgi:hypothetical protein